MIHRFWKIARSYGYPLILLVMTGIICFTAYKPGTWLTGWDSLHPEFEFDLNFQRIINGVWREEQGLGTVAAHAHMSELPRYIFLWFSSWIFPLSFLRYLYVFICFMLGPLGLYFFLQYVLHEREKSGYHLSESVINASAFLGALFYIFNLAVLHHFLVPFEMFPTKYGLLPWLFLFATRYFQKKTKKDLWLFALTTFFSTPMAYAFQLWYVYFGSLGLYISGLMLMHRSRSYIKRGLVILALTLAINAYWFLPHLYFVATAAKHIPEAHSNMLFSERMFAFNRARGSVLDVIILQGALYDWSKFDGQSFVSLFGSWKGHLDQPLVLAIAYGAFGMVIIGLVRLLFHKNTYGYILFPVLLVCFIFMANTSPPFDFLFAYLREHISLLKEGLRSPYTKFSIMLLFTYSFFFAYAQPAIIGTIGATQRRIYVLSITILFIVYLYPLFTGHLIEKSMKVKIPNEYFQTFSWFQKQPSDTRIATFPVHSFWGWDYYKWGYQGAGFIWFGLPQTVLVRDFDRWNQNNENFYWELSYAVYSENPNKIATVLHKYNVNWLIVDKNIISPPNPKALYFDEFDSLIADIPFIKKEKSYGDIEIYKVNLEYKAQNWQYTLENPEIIAPTYFSNNNDQAFAEYGHYVSTTDKSIEPSVIYPFRSIFTGRATEKPFLDVTEDQDSYYLHSNVQNIENFDSKYTLVTDKIDSLEDIDKDSLELEDTLYPQAVKIGDELAVKIPKLNDFYSYSSKKDPNYFYYPLTRCDQSLRGPVDKYVDQKGNIKYISTNGSNCLDILLPQLTHRLSYLVSIDSTNIEGTPFLFSIQNIDSKKSEADTYLPKGPNNTTSINGSTSHFIIPPMDYYGLQYALHFDNLSIGSEPTVNELGNIHIQQFPYNFIQTMRWEKTRKHISGNYAIYSQSFDNGWLAYKLDCSRIVPCSIQKTFPMIFGKRLKEHVLVNNWANGWKLPEDKESLKNIKIIFWPQYLEYVGIAIVIISFVNLTYISLKHSKSQY